MKLEILGDHAPSGVYMADFLGVERDDYYNPDEPSPSLRWRFRVVRGQYDGHLICGFTDLVPRDNNSCGRFLGAITGDEPVAGLSVELDDFVGQRYLLVVDVEPGSYIPSIEACVAVSGRIT